MNRERLNQLQQRHGEIVTAAKEKISAAEAKADGPSDTDKEEIAALLAQADEVKVQAADVEAWIKNQEQVAAHQAWRDEVQKVQLPEPVAANAPDPGSTPQTKARRATETPEYAAAFNRWITHGSRSPMLAGGYASAEQMAGVQLAADDPMQTDVDSAGGYLIPDRLADEVIQEADRAFVGLQAVRSQTLGFGESMTYPYISRRLGGAQRAGERGGTPPQSRPTVNTFTLLPKMVWNKTAATIVMLMNRHFDTEMYLKDELLYTLMYRCEEDTWRGVGGTSPLGAMVASPAGISTGRDQATLVANGIGWDGLFQARYKKLRPPYWSMAKWYFNPGLAADLRKLDDDNGNLLWQPSAQMDAPDRLDGIPVMWSEFIESSLTDGNYIGLLGNMGYIRRAEYPSIAIQRLVELGAEENEVQFIARKWDDSNCAHEQAFVRMRVGAS